MLTRLNQARWLAGLVVFGWMLAAAIGLLVASLVSGDVGFAAVILMVVAIEVWLLRWHWRRRPPKAHVRF